jgi:hypothetical protein
MSFLQSSIFGKEFVNYRKNIAHFERVKFSSRIKNGVSLPVVIDSVESELSVLLGGDTRKYGRQYSFKKDQTLEEIYNQICNDIKNSTVPDINTQEVLAGKKLRIGLEDGTILTDLLVPLETVYNSNYNTKDNILYLLITRENTMYGYIMSIIKYLTEALFSSKK